MVVLNIDRDELARRQELDRHLLRKRDARIREDAGEPELADALAAARDGNPEALRFLYERYSARIYALLVRITGNEHEAEDLTQAALMRLFSKIHLYRADAAPFHSWLLTVARNLAMDQLRRPRAMTNAHDALRDLETEDGLHERSHALCDAFAGLPADQRSVALLRYVRGLSPGEIAMELGRSEASIHGLHNRARASLRSTLTAVDCAPTVAA